MEQDITSFWAQIKKYEDALASDPTSYNFVPLAELYRKMELLDDAILVAKKGCEVHPDYVGGFMALGRAYFDKGMKDESRAALEKVVGLTPDNLLARRLLGQIYAESGQASAAEESLRYILSQNPEDQESLALLETLHPAVARDVSGQEGGASGAHRSEEHDATDELFFEFSPIDDDIIEDAELVEELTDEILPEEVASSSPSVLPDVEAPSPYLATAEEEVEGELADESDPLITVTMAELYASQGFLKRALTIYRGLLESDPENAEWNNRLYELKMAIDEDTEIARHNVAEGGVPKEEPVTNAAVAAITPDAGESLPVTKGKEPAATAVAVGTPLETLEKWLETIRRRR
jgi:tetratricopeptide (TPR) repeat protein